MRFSESSDDPTLVQALRVPTIVAPRQRSSAVSPMSWKTAIRSRSGSKDFRSPPPASTRDESSGLHPISSFEEYRHVAAQLKKPPAEYTSVNRTRADLIEADRPLTYHFGIRAMVCGFAVVSLAFLLPTASF